MQWASCTIKYKVNQAASKAIDQQASSILQPVVMQGVNRAAAHCATQLPDQCFHVLLAVAAIVDKVDPAVLQSVALLLDGGHISRHEVVHNCWLAHPLRSHLQGNSQRSLAVIHHSSGNI